MNRYRNQSSFDGAEPTDASTAKSRSRARRTAEQVVKKRLQDRESQRNVRQRTKAYVASLETKIALLEAPECLRELLKKNTVLECRVKELQGLLYSISKLAESGGCNVEHAEEIENQEAQQSTPPPDDTQDAAAIQTVVRGGESTMVPDPTGTSQLESDLFKSGEVPTDTAGSLSVPNQEPRSEPNPSKNSGSESDVTEDIHNVCAPEFGMEFLDFGGEDIYNMNSRALEPNTVNHSVEIAAMLRVDLSQQPSELESHLEISKESWDLAYTSTLAHSRNLEVQETVVPMEITEESHNDFNAANGALDDEPSLSVCSDVIAAVRPNRQALRPAIDHGRFPSALLQCQREKPNYTVLSQHCSPTNMWDVKLIRHITERRSSPYSAPIFSDFDDCGPDIGPFLGSDSASPVIDPSTTFLAEAINRWNFDLPEKLGLLWLHYIYLRYRVLPNLKNSQQLPDWFMQRASQCVISHPVWIDTLPWPRLRDKLTFEYSAFPLETFCPLFCSSLSINWKPDDQSTYKINKNGTRVLSSAFIEHLKDLENWTLSPAFADAFPDLAPQVYISEKIVV